MRGGAVQVAEVRGVGQQAVQQDVAQVRRDLVPAGVRGVIQRGAGGHLLQGEAQQAQVGGGVGAAAGQRLHRGPPGPVQRRRPELDRGREPLGRHAGGLVGAEPDGGRVPEGQRGHVPGQLPDQALRLGRRGLGAAGRGRAQLGERPAVGGEQIDGDLFLRGEVVIEAARQDAERLGDVAHGRGRVPRLLEEAGGGPADVVRPGTRGRRVRGGRALGGRGVGRLVLGGLVP